MFWGASGPGGFVGVEESRLRIGDLVVARKCKDLQDLGVAAGTTVRF